ncbi:hypothetical protein HDU97_003457 [Phlyctochytrium planicorne]|nr:hypothetical protein HDU97_003457 [Phlyctochytrium planicorne]
MEHHIPSASAAFILHDKLIQVDELGGKAGDKGRPSSVASLSPKLSLSFPLLKDDDSSNTNSNVASTSGAEDSTLFSRMLNRMMRRPLSFTNLPSLLGASSSSSSTDAQTSSSALGKNAQQNPKVSLKDKAASGEDAPKNGWRMVKSIRAEGTPSASTVNPITIHNNTSSNTKDGSAMLHDHDLEFPALPTSPNSATHYHHPLFRPHHHHQHRTTQPTSHLDTSSMKDDDSDAVTLCSLDGTDASGPLFQKQSNYDKWESSVSLRPPLHIVVPGRAGSIGDDASSSTGSSMMMTMMAARHHHQHKQLALTMPQGPARREGGRKIPREIIGRILQFVAYEPTVVMMEKGQDAGSFGETNNNGNNSDLTSQQEPAAAPANDDDDDDASSTTSSHSSQSSDDESTLQMTRSTVSSHHYLGFGGRKKSGVLNMLMPMEDEPLTEQEARRATNRDRIACALVSKDWAGEALRLVWREFPILLHGLCASTKCDRPLSALSPLSPSSMSPPTPCSISTLINYNGNNQNHHNNNHNHNNNNHPLSLSLEDSPHLSSRHSLFPSSYASNMSACTAYSATNKPTASSYLRYASHLRSLDVEILFPSVEDRSGCMRLADRIMRLRDAVAGDGAEGSAVRKVRVSLNWVPKDVVMDDEDVQEEEEDDEFGDEIVGAALGWKQASPAIPISSSRSGLSGHPTGVSLPSRRHLESRRRPSPYAHLRRSLSSFLALFASASATPLLESFKLEVTYSGEGRGWRMVEPLVVNVGKRVKKEEDGLLKMVAGKEEDQTEQEQEEEEVAQWVRENRGVDVVVDEGVVVGIGRR